MTSREQFEAYGLSQEGGLGPGHLVRGENGEYLNFAAQCYWDFWQASRQAVQLPQPFAVIGDYAACGGGRAVCTSEFAEKVTDRMCEKTPVYDLASLVAAGLCGEVKS